MIHLHVTLFPYSLLVSRGVNLAIVSYQSDRKIGLKDSIIYHIVYNLTYAFVLVESVDLFFNDLLLNSFEFCMITCFLKISLQFSAFV